MDPQPTPETNNPQPVSTENTSTPTPVVTAPQTSSIPSNTSSESKPEVKSVEVTPKKPSNFWKVFMFLLILFILLGGAFYYLYTQKNLGIIEKVISLGRISSQPTSTSIPVSIDTSKSNEIRVGGLIFTYPDEWVPIFSEPVEGKNAVYFAKDKETVNTLIDCVKKNQCANYPLKLEDFSTYSVWPNTSIEDFIRQTQKDIQLDSLQKTTIDGRTAWAGYVDDEHKNYQVVIDSTIPDSTNFVSITASTTDLNSGMLNEYVSMLTKIKVNGITSVRPESLTTNKGFILNISSSLVSRDFITLNIVLNSLLAPNGSTKPFNYFLYTQAGKSTDGVVGGPNYPQDDYFNTKYFLLTDNENLKDGTYETPQVSIKLESSPIKDFGNYLSDPKYCTQDSDCGYRANFCNVGAYNQYHQFFTPWGCGMGNIEGLGDSLSLMEKLGCQKDVEAKYDSIKCVNNSCQMVNPVAACKN